MEVSPALLEPLRTLGAVHFSIALNLVSDRELRVYCDYPSDWQDLYFRKALYFDDPVFLSAPFLRETVTWMDLGHLFPHSSVIGQAREHGLENGLSIPVRIGDNTHVVSITLDQVSSPTPSHRSALLRAARQLGATLADRPCDAMSRIQSLAYFLASHGLKPGEIADILQDQRAGMQRRAARTAGRGALH